MNSKERQRLVSSWLLLLKTPEAGSPREDLSWVVEKVWDLCDDAPNEALEFILAVLDRDASATTMAILSAGPLEALLRRHGPRIINRVERRARRDATFARLLGHVWKDTLSTPIWMRVQSLCERPSRTDLAEA
jgi:hypothetical protein